MGPPPSSIRAESVSSCPPRSHREQSRGRSRVSPTRRVHLMCLGLVAAAVTPRTTSAGADGAAAIVAAEKAFATQVRAQGVREGFLAWLAPTSVVFRPWPVGGLKAYEKQQAGW